MVIEWVEQEKNVLVQVDGNDVDDWCMVFCVVGGVLSDELKQCYIDCVVCWELVQEYDNLVVVLNFECECLKGVCDSMVIVYWKVYYYFLSLYVEYELEYVLNEICEVFVWVMYLSILVQENLFVNIIGYQGYVVFDKVVMQQVKLLLEQKIKQM